MEKVDIYNRFREKTDKIKNRNELDIGEYRISVHVWVKDLKDRILILKRSDKEDKFPGMWSQLGGGVISGDTSKETVFKECKEELNLDVKENNLFYIASYIRKNDIVDVFMIEQDIDSTKLVLAEDEVVEVKLVSIKEFNKMIKNNEVVPTINPSYYLFKDYNNRI